MLQSYLQSLPCPGTGFSQEDTQAELEPCLHQYCLSAAPGGRMGAQSLLLPPLTPGSGGRRSIAWALAPPTPPPRFLQSSPFSKRFFCRSSALHPLHIILEIHVQQHSGQERKINHRSMSFSSNIYGFFSNSKSNKHIVITEVFLKIEGSIKKIKITYNPIIKRPDDFCTVSDSALPLCLWFSVHTHTLTHTRRGIMLMVGIYRHLSITVCQRHFLSY